MVIAGGGHVFVLGTDQPSITIAERLSERWSVTVSELPAHAPRPGLGDVVIWRVPGDLFGPFWTGPTRVVSVREVDAGRVEVYTLTDDQTDQRGPGEYSQWFQESFSTDCIVAPDEQWDLLAYWGLHPLCPRCGGTTRRYLYGMPAFMPDADDEDAPILGGCVIDEWSPRHRCSGCGHGFGAA